MRCILFRDGDATLAAAPGKILFRAEVRRGTAVMRNAILDRRGIIDVGWRSSSETIAFGEATR